MSKKPYNVLAKTAMAAALLIPTVPFVADAASAAEQTQVAEGIYLYSPTGESKYVTLTDYALMTDAEFTTLINEFGMENIHFVVDNEYVNLNENIYEGAQYQPIKDGDIPAGKYEGTGGTVVIGDETPEEKVNETFFYNLAA